MRRMTQDNLTSVLREHSAYARGVLPFPVTADATLDSVLEHIYNTQYDELARYAAHFAGEDEADDIVSAAFVEVLERMRNAPTARPLDQLPAVVFGAVRFRAIDYRNALIRRRPLIARYVQDAIARFGAWFEPREVREQTALTRAIAAAVATMPPLVREMYVLHHECGLPPRMIVERTGRGMSSVRALITRCNTILREHLGHAGFSGAAVRKGEAS